MNVLTSITVLGFLIFFHEMGHFLAAILENGQQSDGSVKIPDALVPYFGSNFIKTL